MSDSLMAAGSGSIQSYGGANLSTGAQAFLSAMFAPSHSSAVALANFVAPSNGTNIVADGHNSGQFTSV